MKYIFSHKKRKRTLVELEERRRQLLDSLLEIEKSPGPKKKGLFREIYYEIFGGMPQDMIPEDRIPTQENEEYEFQQKLGTKKNGEPGKKDGGFFKAIKNVFRGGNKADTKQVKKTDATKTKEFSRNNVTSNGGTMQEELYEDDCFRDKHFAGVYVPKEHRNSLGSTIDRSAFTKNSSPFDSPGLGENKEYRRRYYSNALTPSSGNFTDR